MRNTLTLDGGRAFGLPSSLVARFRLLLLSPMPVHSTALDALAESLPLCVPREVFDQARAKRLSGATELGASDDEAAIFAALEQFQSAGCNACVVDDRTAWQLFVDRLRGGARRSAGRAGSAPAKPSVSLAPARREERAAQLSSTDATRRNAALFGLSFFAVVAAVAAVLFSGAAPPAPLRPSTSAASSGAGGGASGAANAPGASARSQKLRATAGSGGPGSETLDSEASRRAAQDATRRDGRRPEAPEDPWYALLKVALSFVGGALVAQGMGYGVLRATPPTEAPPRGLTGHGSLYAAGALVLGVLLTPLVTSLLPEAPDEAPLEDSPEPASAPSRAPPRAEPALRPFARLIQRASSGAETPAAPGPSPFARWMQQFRARRATEAPAGAPNTAATVALSASREGRHGADGSHRGAAHSSRGDHRGDRRHGRHAGRHRDGGAHEDATAAGAAPQDASVESVTVGARGDGGARVVSVAVPYRGTRENALGRRLDASVAGGGDTSGGTADRAATRTPRARSERVSKRRGRYIGLVGWFLLGVAAGVMVSPSWRTLRRRVA